MLEADSWRAVAAAFGSDWQPESLASCSGVCSWLRMICVVAVVGVMTLMDGKWRCCLCGLLLLVVMMMTMSVMMMMMMLRWGRGSKQAKVFICLFVVGG